MHMSGLSPLFAAAVLLTACAHPSQQTAGPAQPQTHGHAHAEQPAAAGKVCPQPAMACADTVTASFDPHGRLWLAWVNGTTLYVQHSDDHGLSYNEPVPVNNEPEAIQAHGEYRPKIAADSHGRVYLSWTRSLEKRYSGNIRFSRSSDGGRRFAAPETLNDNLDAISHRFDELLADDNGRVAVAWLDARDKTADPGFAGVSVYYARSDDAGASFHPNRQVAAHSCECCRLAAALDARGNPALVWRAVLAGGIRDHVLGQFSDWDTPLPALPLPADHWQTDACPHHGPALAVDGHGGYHVAWFSAAPGHSGLFYSRATTAGFTPPMAFGGQGASHPHLAALDRHIALVWTEYDGSQTSVRLQTSQDAGQTWSPAASIASTAAAADNAFLLSDGHALYLSWQTGSGYLFKPL